jgi:hypothetical protein
MKFVIYNSPKIKNINERALDILKKNKICIIKNFHELNHTKKIIKFFKKNFDPKKDIKISGQRRLKQGDYQRLDIGNSYKYPRFLRSIYINELLKKNEEIFRLIKPIIETRNYVSKIEKYKNFYPKVRGMLNSADLKKYSYRDFVRMIQYPFGGGFLGEHVDYDKYYCRGVYQAILPLTVKKNKKRRSLATYKEGGLYFKIKQNKIYVEDYLEARDLLLFDPRVNHGVESVDTARKLDLKNLNGRLTLAFSITNFLIK